MPKLWTITSQAGKWSNLREDDLTYLESVPHQNWDAVFVRFCLQITTLLDSQLRVKDIYYDHSFLECSNSKFSPVSTAENSHEILSTFLFSVIILCLESIWRINQMTQGENFPLLTGLLDVQVLAAMVVPNSNFCVISLMTLLKALLARLLRCCILLPGFLAICSMPVVSK